MGTVRVYVYNATDKRHISAQQYTATINGEYGQQSRYHTLFNLPPGKHHVTITEKPNGLAFKKWESVTGGPWQEITVRQPTHISADIITADEPGFLRAHLIRRSVAELLRERHTIMDQLTSLVVPTYEEMEAHEVIYLCEERWPDVSTVIWDGKYRFAAYEQTLKMIEVYWGDDTRYEHTWWDCDDFSLAAKFRLAALWGVNGVGFAEGWKWKNGVQIALHAYNYILVHDNEGVKLLLFEPQNDKLSFDDTIGNITYIPYKIIW